MYRRIMTVVALALLGAACTRLRGGSKGEGTAVAARPDSIFVDALNENYFAARIHAVYDGGVRRSLGTIAGNGGRARMALAWEPRALVFEVLLVTDGSTYVSHPLDVAAGQSLDIRVPSNIAESGFWRLRRN